MNGLRFREPRNSVQRSGWRAHRLRTDRSAVRRWWHASPAVTRSGMSSRAVQQPGRQKQDCAQEREQGLERDADKPKWQRHQPHNRPQHQCSHGQRPVHDEQQASGNDQQQCPHASSRGPESSWACASGTKIQSRMSIATPVTAQRTDSAKISRQIQAAMPVISARPPQTPPNHLSFDISGR